MQCSLQYLRYAHSDGSAMLKPPSDKRDWAGGGCVWKGQGGKQMTGLHGWGGEKREEGEGRE